MGPLEVGSQKERGVEETIGVCGLEGSGVVRGREGGWRPAPEGWGGSRREMCNYTKRD